MTPKRELAESYLQHTRARSADERADRHVDVSRPALVAIEALLVARLRDEFPQRLQVPLVLLSLGGRHRGTRARSAGMPIIGTGFYFGVASVTLGHERRHPGAGGS